jgi:outer membrane autotransporter protein
LRSKNTTDFHGLQGGFDVAGCDLGSLNATIHAGVTIGSIVGSSQQTNGGLGVDFESTMIGAYGALIVGQFTADVLLRYDFHNFDLAHANNEIIARGTDVDGSTISGTFSTGYSLMLGESVILKPAAGVTVARTSIDSFAVNGGGIFSLEDQTSIMGYAGATLQGTLPVSDDLILFPFVSAAVYNEFGDGAQSVLELGQTVNLQTGTTGTFGQVGGGMNFYVPAGSGSALPFVVGGVRVDGQFGDRLEGWAVTGNARLQF